MKILKFAALTSVTLLLLMVFPHTAYADTGNFTYNIGQNGILITGYTGSDSDLTIPREIDGQVVTGIYSGAFSTALTLTSVVIPDSVTYIGDYAFSYCSNLASVKFTGDAPAIGVQVFGNCSPGLVIYYDSAKNGFSNPWNGFTTSAYSSVPESTAVTGISLDRTSAVLTVGERLSLLPTISPAEAANKNISWTSSSIDVATVDGTGAVNALREGNTTITATTEDGSFTATCSIYVANLPAVPGNELAVPLNYDAVQVLWSEVPDANGYEVYRSNTVDGEYVQAAEVESNEFNDSGLKTGTLYYYKVRAYKTVNDINIYSDYTPAITVKTLNKSIGSTLFLYMSDLDNRNKVLARAIALHNGDPSNTCAYTVSEALRKIGLSIPSSTGRTNQVESNLAARGWKREMNLNLLQPGDICFTTDKYGNLLGGHSTHVFIFMGWANKEKTLMNICDNQTGRYNSVLHTRTIFRSSSTEATAFFYHTDISGVDLILKLPSTISAASSAYNKVKISWTAASGAYGYRIYRSTSKNGTYSYIANTRSTSYTDSALTTGKTYYYKVRAYSNVDNAVIYGNYSNISSAAPKLSVPPALANSASKGKVTLSWKGVSGASGYQIYRTKDKNGTYTLVTSTSHTSFTNSGLTSGRYYYYKVRAYRYVGKTKVYSGYTYITIKAR